MLRCSAAGYLAFLLWGKKILFSMGTECLTVLRIVYGVSKRNVQGIMIDMDAYPPEKNQEQWKTWTKASFTDTAEGK